MRKNLNHDAIDSILIHQLIPLLWYLIKAEQNELFDGYFYLKFLEKQMYEECDELLRV